MQKWPKLEAKQFMLSRKVYKELCRAAAYRRMSPSVYLECLVVSDKVRRDIGEHKEA
ncbi:hypothetical protein ACMXYO_10125 [Neptuniibacter sp. QD37_6]|uniref:hypothetical protein n=1 Tax=Neptuniibacter sp. QD37_6 TaxID=3398210 RepID=UPI0039F4F43A